MVRKKSLGYAFRDELAKVSFPSKKVKNKNEDSNWTDYLLPNFGSEFKQTKLVSSPFRTILILSVCLVIFAIILMRLFHLQIVKGKDNRELADGNRIGVKVIHAPRGVIFDRNGKILAANSPAFRLFDETTQRAKLISREEALEFEVNDDPRAQSLEIDSVRNYPMGEKTAHILGYVGEISQDQLKSGQFKGYRMGDRIGLSGIEAQYESLLRGADGGEIIEVDSKGVKIRTLRKTPPISGQNIYLAIDADLQDKVYQKTLETLIKVNSCCGAVVAMEPASGQILALLSFPTFDPNLFTRGIDEGEINRIFSHPNSPILNRAIAGTYPPGSTFKIVSALAALSSGKITPQTVFEDSGVIYLGTFRFSNWYFNQYGKTEGLVNLIKALKRSNDTYFYRVGQTIGEQGLIDWSKKLLLGQTMGIDLPGEETGLVPDEAWKQKALNLPWYPGDTLHLSIGQGFILTTPLQILGVTSFVSADGSLFKPQLLKRVESGGKVLKEFKPQILLKGIVPKSDVSVIKEGLKEAAKSGGTAWPFFTFPIETAGKTGTAEYGDPKDRTHAWYTSFAPVDDPKIVMTVLIEGGGEGSSVAAPIVKEALRWYLSEDKNNLIKDIYPQATDSGRSLGE
ncbi:penicillin-binding protein 2 [Candidatus Microgenomates bacterium]|nr:penicillin-binding protein 2 [Candidatus Microgenomates bacterium]